MTPLFRRLSAAAALALGLSACAQTGTELLRWPWPETALPADQPYRLKVPPVEPPPPRPQVIQKMKADKPAQPSAPPPVLTADRFTPLLVGLTEDETAQLLGRPAAESERPPGKVWTYRADGCELDVHLFPDMDRGGFYALDYTAGEAPRDWCLGRVSGEARKRG